MNKRNLKNVFKQYADRVQREDEELALVSIAYLITLTILITNRPVEKQLVKHRGQEIPLAKILRLKLGTFGDSSKRRNISDHILFLWSFYST